MPLNAHLLHTHFGGYLAQLGRSSEGMEQGVNQ